MRRRFLSISAIALGLPLWLISSPIWLPIALLADLLGGYRRLPSPRLGLFLGVYLVHEWIGVSRAAWLWLRGGFGRRLDPGRHRDVQGWWASSLLTWAGRLLGVAIEPVDPSSLPPSNIILISRHASMVDAVLPAALLTGQAGRFVHYVLKRELQWDPSIDLFGSRLGNHFVARTSDGDRETTAIEDLARRAHPDSAMVIFPEGTYSTPERRQRVLASLNRRGEQEAVAAAERLTHLLPPRPGGTLALLRGRPDADVVVLGHVGLEGVAELRGLRRNLPLEHPVRVDWWVHPRSELPTDDDGLTAWLNKRWMDLDSWVERNRPGTPADS